MGQKVDAGTYSGAIDVAALEQGLYILQLKSGQYSETAKFIVK